jgi:transcriptional regulator with XRE-family HTH domain
MEIGNIIACIRKIRKIKQGDFAEKVGISRVYLSDLERDKKIPHRDTLEKICNALEIPVPIVYILASTPDDWNKEGWSRSFLKEYSCIKDFILNEERLINELKALEIQKVEKVPD